MRDWTRTLPNASFRGRRFFIEQEEITEAGRRIAVHEYAKSDEHATEDMGRKTRRFRFEAYLVGDRADRDAQAFVEMVSAGGTGPLVLPVLGIANVRCTNCSAVSEVRRFGYVKLSLEFIEAGNNSAFSVVALGDRIAASLQGGMAGAVQTAISAFSG